MALDQGTRLHWAKPASVADADQEVAPILGILRFLRANQWIVLFRQADRVTSGYFPFRKRDIQSRLDGARPLDLVSRVLGLPETGVSSVQRRVWSLQQAPENFELATSVWVDDAGEVLGIGIPVSHRRKTGITTSELSIAASDRSIVADRIEAMAAEAIVYLDPEQNKYLDFSDRDVNKVLHSIETGPYAQVDLPAPGSQQSESDLVIPVYYATDRQIIEGGSTSYVEFSGERSRSGEVTVGVCTVSIPSAHKVGHLETPPWWKFWMHPKRGEHVVLLSVVRTLESDFYRYVGTAIDRSPRRDVFVFIHGYNVDFKAAILRTAQLALDLQFQGAPILFSWPSKGKFSKYLGDEGSIQWARPHLQEFLEKLRSTSTTASIHVIAHSMGNRALLDVFQTLSDSPRFSQIILAAPDVDRGVFIQLAHRFPEIAQRVTLYASSKDKALAASKKLHDFQRAGEAGNGLLILAGLDTIDASSVDTDFLGHSLFVEERTLLSDMFGLVVHGHPPSARYGLKRRDAPTGPYWDFLP